MSAQYSIVSSKIDESLVVFRTNDWVDSIEYTVFQAFDAQAVTVKGFRKAFRVARADAQIIEHAFAYLKAHDQSSHRQAWIAMPDDGGPGAGRILKTLMVLDRKTITRMALAHAQED